ncbi:unnamed protein product [Gordionus sp. m RMFG-2023]
MRLLHYFLLTLILINKVYSKSRKNKNVYLNINESYGCFRMLNGTHQIGCSSKMRGGNNGIIYFVLNEAVLDKLINNDSEFDYIAMIYPNLFN